MLLDLHPDIRVIVPTHDGPRSVSVEQLLPFAYLWNDSQSG